MKKFLFLNALCALALLAGCSKDEEKEADEKPGGKEPALVLSAPSIHLEAEIDAIKVVWAKVKDAKSYAVEYAKAADQTFTAAGSTAELTLTISGLESETEYKVRVQAVADKVKSDWSSVESISTLAPEPEESGIKTADEFVKWVNEEAASAAADAVIELAADIDLSGKSLTPIPEFVATLDGKGHKLSNMTLSNALIASLNGTVKNLLIDESCTINWTAAVPDQTGVAFIASTSKGTIQDCTVSGSITVNTAEAGRIYCAGVVGESTTGYVEGCTFKGSIDVTLSGTTASCSAIAGVAGRVGHADKAGQTIVKGCTNEGNIKFLYSGETQGMKKFGVGGVIGQTPSIATTPGNHGIVEDCVNKGNVEWSYPEGGKGSYPALGGVAGIIEGELKGASNYGTISFSGNKTVATTDASIGGVAGYVTGNTYDCHNYGQLALDCAFAGGTALAQSGGNTSFSTFGGVFGNVGPWAADNTSTASMGVTAENISNEAELTINASMIASGGPKMCFGAVIGASTSNLKNVVNNKALHIKTQTKTSYAGGVVGYAAGNMEDCVNNGDLYFDGDKDNHPSGVNSQQEYIGGLAGYVVKALTLKNCENKGSVTVDNVVSTPSAWSYVGGLFGGYVGSITAEGCSNSGDLTVNADMALIMGGLAGGFNGVATGCSNSGKVKKTSSYLSDTANKEDEVGGLVGYANASFTDCQNTGSVESAAAGFLSGFAGGLGSVDQLWTGNTVNCTVDGASIMASVLGRFRNAGTNTLTLGSEEKPFTIKGAIAEKPICGLLNGNSIVEAKVVNE